MVEFGKQPAPLVHASRHEDDGDDEVSVDGLAGELEDSQPSAPHGLAGSKHNAATLAELNEKVSDATLDNSSATRTPKAHSSSHEDGQADEIDVSGLTGTTPRALLGDVTAGRVFRSSFMVIDNGSNASTLKCTLYNVFNGDEIAVVDNIAKNSTTSGYTLNSAGTDLILENAVLSGTVVWANGLCTLNHTAVHLTTLVYQVSDDISITFYEDGSGDVKDLTALVDVGFLYLTLIYITDA